MIPKKIHYCWFGKRPLSKIAKKCIVSWKKYCPDYEIIQWNENNFDINYCNYSRQAYDAGKYAFVSDVARFYILVNHGGIYMDVDHEILKPIDYFLQCKAFCGLQAKAEIGLGILGCEKNFELFKEFLNEYNNIKFKKENGEFDITVVNLRFMEFCSKYGFVKSDKLQNIIDLSIFPSEYFYATSFETYKTTITGNTYSNHHYIGSWCTPKMRVYSLLVKILGINAVKKISNIKNKIIKNS